MKRRKKSFEKVIFNLSIIIAMFMFIASPFSVLAKITTNTSSACVDGTKITNYYLFVEGVGVGFDPANASDSFRSKDFQIGHEGKTVVNYGQINLKSGDSTTIPSIKDSGTQEDWTYKAFYTKFVAARAADSNEYVIDGESGSNTRFAMAVKWYDEKGVEQTGHAGSSATADQMTSATVTGVPTQIDWQSSIMDNSTTNFKIKRVYANASLPSSSYDNKWYFHPALYFVSYCDTSSTTPTADTVTLKYDANGGTLGKVEPSVTKSKDEEFTTDKNEPVRDGYVFKGWSETVNGEVEYKPGDKIGKLSADKTLYAVWEKGFYLDYDPNGGVGAPDKQIAKEGECITISSVKPSLDGSTFLGWAESKTATKPASGFAAGDKYCGPNNKTLYAVWSSAATANPKTGVTDYAIAFGLIAAATGAGLLISKRKKLFKQI